MIFSQLFSPLLKLVNKLLPLIFFNIEKNLNETNYICWNFEVKKKKAIVYTCYWTDRPVEYYKILGPVALRMDRRATPPSVGLGTATSSSGPWRKVKAPRATISLSILKRRRLLPVNNGCKRGKRERMRPRDPRPGFCETAAEVA